MGITGGGPGTNQYQVKGRSIAGRRTGGVPRERAGTGMVPSGLDVPAVRPSGLGTLPGTVLWDAPGDVRSRLGTDREPDVKIVAATREGLERMGVNPDDRYVTAVDPDPGTRSRLGAGPDEPVWATRSDTIPTPAPPEPVTTREDLVARTREVMLGGSVSNVDNETVIRELPCEQVTVTGREVNRCRYPAVVDRSGRVWVFNQDRGNLNVHIRRASNWEVGATAWDVYDPDTGETRTMWFYDHGEYTAVRPDWTELEDEVRARFTCEERDLARFVADGRRWGWD